MAASVGMVYEIMDTGTGMNATHPAYDLYRTASRKVSVWEHHGTDGVLLGLLTEYFLV